MEAREAVRVVMLAVELTGFWGGVWLAVFLWQKLRLPLATAAARLGALAATLAIGALGRDVAALATGSLKFEARTEAPRDTDSSRGATAGAPLPRPRAPSPPTKDCPAGSGIVNGSFEKPEAPIGTVVLADQFFRPRGEEAITGWRVTGRRRRDGTSDVALVSGAYAPDGGHSSYLAKDGAQWLNLAGFRGDTRNGIEQDVCTTPGQRYRLTFWVGNAVDEAHPGAGQTSTVEVWIDGFSKFVAVNSDEPSDSRVAWKRFDMSFVAEKISTRIGLASDDPLGDKVNGVDDVELVLAWWWW
jgi:hypothetical protein